MKKYLIAVNPVEYEMPTYFTTEANTQKEATSKFCDYAKQHNIELEIGESGNNYEVLEIGTEVQIIG